MDLKLYYAPGACSFAPHMVLEELGLAYTTQRLDLAAGDQRKPEYLKINPHGRVPTLVIDGKSLTENVAILTFLGGGFASKGLWPEDTLEQAHLVSLLAWCAGTVHATYGHLMRPARYSDDPTTHEALKSKARTMFGEYLEEIDRRLAGKKWALGNRYTVADPYFLVFYRWGNRNQFPVRSLANYTAHSQRMLARKAVKKVMADEGITLD